MVSGGVGVAEAIFDNESEWPDELGFRRGERLRVLDTRPAGGLASGWWLCADAKGNRGIAPANRLHLLSSPGQAPLRLLHDAAHPLRLHPDPLRLSRELSAEAKREPIIRSVPIQVESEASSGHSPRRHSPPPPPQRRYFNHFTPSGNDAGGPESSLSHTPPDASSLLSDSSNSTSAPDAYDVPSALIMGGGGGGGKESSSKGPWWRAVEVLPAEMERLSVGSEAEWESLLDGARELRLSVPEATSRLIGRQEELNSAVSSLTSIASHRHWRRRRNLNESLPHLRKAVGDVSSALNGFVDFATGALVNLSNGLRSEVGATARRLAHMLRPLRDSQRLLDAQRGAVTRMGWTAAALAREAPSGSDPLDQFLAVAASLPDDTRHVTTFLQTHAALAFSAPIAQAAPSLSAAATPPSVTESREKSRWSPGKEEKELDSSLSSDRESLFDDYDFVDAPRESGRNGDSEEAKTPTRETLDTGASGETTTTEVVDFYAGQVEQQMEWLAQAIEDFLSAIEENHSPLLYVGKSKLVVLAAHKLVYVGDSLAQLEAGSEAGREAKAASDRLCQVLKDAVAATKAAAASHPDVPKVKVMVDAMVAVSESAATLKQLIRRRAVEARRN